MGIDGTLLASASSRASTGFGGAEGSPWFVSSSPFGDRAFVDPAVSLCVGPPSPVKLPGPRFGCDLWRLRGGPAGRDPVAPDPPPLRITVSPSPPPTLRIRSLGVGYGSVGPVSPGNRGESVGADESQDARPHASPKEMLQHPPLGAGDNRSGSDLVSPENCDWVARTDEGPNEKLHPSPRATLQDPSYSVSGTDLQDTLSSGSALRVGVSDKRSGELFIPKLDFAIAEIGVRSDFNYGSEGCVSATQEDDLDDFEASGTLPILTFPTRTLHGWRFGSECR